LTPIRLCATAGCPNPAAPRKSRCPIHAAEQRKANRSRFDGFYSSKPWRMSRRQQLFAHPLCQFVMDDGTGCGLLADSVHHIVQLEDGGAPRDPANLMSLCRSHHSVIHAQRRHGVREGRR
jgi:5-methylcytosine-specific restriction endonuclease McrA